jgi:hypothetical protein
MSTYPFLGEYLADNVRKGVIDFALRANVAPDGSVEFYIHPAGVSGDTCDYIAECNRPEVWNSRALAALVSAIPKKGTP